MFYGHYFLKIWIKFKIFTYTFNIFLYILYKYIYINIDEKISIEVDNEFESYLHENENPFYYNNTQLKSIALYDPEFNNVSHFKIFQFF